MNVVDIVWTPLSTAHATPRSSEHVMARRALSPTQRSFSYYRVYSVIILLLLISAPSSIMPLDVAQSALHIDEAYHNIEIDADFTIDDDDVA